MLQSHRDFLLLILPGKSDCTLCQTFLNRAASMLQEGQLCGSVTCALVQGSVFRKAPCSAVILKNLPFHVSSHLINHVLLGPVTAFCLCSLCEKTILCKKKIAIYLTFKYFISIVLVHFVNCQNNLRAHV